MFSRCKNIEASCAINDSSPMKILRGVAAKGRDLVNEVILDFVLNIMLDFILEIVFDSKKIGAENQYQ